MAALCCLSFPACNDCPVASVEDVDQPEVVSDEQLAEEGELVVEEAESDLELTSYSEEISDPTLWYHEELTEMDMADIFGDESALVGDEPYANMFLEPKLQLTAPLTQIGPSVATMEQELLKSQREQVGHQQAEPCPTSPVVTNPQAVVSSGSFSFWRSCGLGLALVLTGQFYVRFGKRSASA